MLSLLNARRRARQNRHNRRQSANFFSSVTKRPNYIPYLDGWRGIAILLVLLHHFAGFEAGNLGVQVFFVLSGKLMSQVLFVDRTPLGVFYRRRVARVFPLFYLYLAVVAAGFIVFMPGQPLDELVYTTTFLRTYLPGQQIWDLALPTGHVWSLNVEEHSYVVLSAIALLVARRGVGVAKVATLLLTVGCVAAYDFYSKHPPSPLASPAMLRTECAAFALMLSASLHLWIRRPSVLQFWCALTAVAALFVAHLLGTRVDNPIKLLLLPAALAVLINVLSAAPRAFLDVLSAPWLRWFGVISFSLYMWNTLFLWLSMRDVMSQAQGAVLSIAVGALSYYYFEAPMRSLIRNGFVARRPATVFKDSVVVGQ